MYIYLNVGGYYYQLSETKQASPLRKELLKSSIFFYTEAGRIYTKILGLHNRLTVDVLSNLDIISKLYSEA
jgi:hypothetical protein